LAIGLVMVEVIAPGAGLHLKASAGEAAGALKAPPMTVGSFLTNLVPTSIFDALARNEVLQIVVFSIVTGIALTRLGARGRHLLVTIEQLANLVLQMAMFVMNLAPLAVFAAVASALAAHGTEIIARYASYVGGFFLALALLWAALMVAGAVVLGVKGQKILMRAIREPALIALATTS
jgi:Na+/H+-dicarboxylate symporter